MTDFKVMAELGILISGSTPQNVTPEKAIVLSFESVVNDLGGLMLIHTWIQKNHDLIHTEALVNELKNKPAVLKLVAGALFCTGEKRFNKIYSLAELATVIPQLGKTISFAVTIGQINPMLCYEKFGLIVSDFPLESDRKFRSREVMLNTNSFFFCRTLFGVNWRADVAACFFIDFDKNPTTIRNFLNCSYETSYRNYHDLISVGWNKNMKSLFKKKAV